MELLQKEITRIQTVIRETGKTTFAEFSPYLVFKISRFQTELDKLKRIEETGNKTIAPGVSITPVKIKDNIEFYKLWKRNNTDPSIEVQLPEVENIMVNPK
jgi:hypothetical protein